MKKPLLFCFVATASILTATAQTNNFGIGTTTPGSKLTVSGSFAAPYKIVSATAAVGANDFYTAYNGSANGTLTLPAATVASPAAGNILGRMYHFKNTGTAILTIAANGAELIDNQNAAGVTSVALNPGDYAMFISKGTISGTTWEVAISTANIVGLLTSSQFAIGTTAVNIPVSTTADIPGAVVTVTCNVNSRLVINMSALPVPTNANAPVQGSIDLLQNGTKITSHYYSATDAPTALVKLGNISGSVQVVDVTPGTYIFKLQAKSWNNTTSFNLDPFAGGYAGAIATDANAMKAHLLVQVFTR